MKKTLALLSAVIIGTSGAMASSPIQVSLTPDVAIASRHEQINGLSISLWGENPQTGLALGVANGSTGNSAGFSFAFLINYADNYKGIQWAPINYTKGDFLGWQTGFVNYTDGTMKGLQSGVVNYAGKLTGLQFGFVNYAESAETGVQIGLINFIPDNAWFSDLPDGLAPEMVFVNWRF